MNYCNDLNWIAICAMAGNYNHRKVERTERDNFILDTVKVYDRDWLYETAVKHKNFYGNNWIILEGCDTKEEAIEMHNKWLEKMEKNDFNILTDYYDGTSYLREGNK